MGDVTLAGLRLTGDEWESMDEDVRISLIVATITREAAATEHYELYELVLDDLR